MNDARKKVLVDQYQSKLAFRFVLYWVVFALTVFNLLFAWRIVKEGRGDLWQQFTATINDNVPLFLCLLVIVPWMTWDAVKFASRIVGPLVRFRNTMHAVTNNEPVQAVRLRKDDFLTDVQHDLNIMLIALDHRGAIQLQNKDDVGAGSRS